MSAQTTRLGPWNATIQRDLKYGAVATGNTPNSNVSPFVAATTGVNAAPALPSDIAAGDLMLLQWYTSQAPSTASAPATPAGWTRVGAPMYVSNDLFNRSATFYRVYAPGDAIPNPVGSTNNLLFLTTWRGIDQTYPLAALPVTVTATTGADAISAPTQDVAVSGVIAVRFCNTRQGTAIEQANVGNVIVNTGNTMCCWQQFSGAGALGAFGFTWTLGATTQATATTIPLRLATAGTLTTLDTLIPTHTPTAYHKLVDASGNLVDSSGNGRDQVVVGGLTYQSQPFIDGRLYGAWNEGRAGLASSTWSSWQTTGLTVGAIIMRRINETIVAPRRVFGVNSGDWELGYDAASSWYCLVGAASQITAAGATAVIQRSFMVVATINSTGGVALYVNGQLVNSASGTPTNDTSGTYGTGQGISASNTRGVVGHQFLVKSVLTPTQIAALYASALDMGLVGCPGI
jgi:hypothetical protein